MYVNFISKPLIEPKSFQGINTEKNQSIILNTWLFTPQHDIKIHVQTLK